MKDGPLERHADDETPRPGESFLQRFYRRKSEAHNTPSPPATPPATDALDAQPAAPAVSEIDAPPELTDADMPPIETLTPESDYTGFLSPKISEGLRRTALRKLFQSPEFNVLDGLDDYAEDFTTFKALGDIVTSDMRHLIEVEARKQAEALERALLDDEKQDVATTVDAPLSEPEPAAEDDIAGTRETPPNRSTGDP